MNAVADWIVAGLMRATLGLSIAGFLIGAALWLLRIRAPRAEQWAWVFVLAQGLVFAPLALPVPAHWIDVPPAHLEKTEIPARTAVNAGTEAGQVVEHSVPQEQVGHDKMSPPAIDATALPTLIDSSPMPARRPFPWTVATMVLWLAGVGACLGLGLCRYLAFLRSLRGTQALAVLPSTAGTPASPWGGELTSFAAWHDEWRQILEDHRISIPIPLVVTTSAGPAICRVWREYCLVLPAEIWAELTPAERQSILRHELAHLRLGDLWTTLVVRCLAALHWFNPVAWWAASRFEAQSEFLCDEAGAGPDPATYAAVLLRLGAARGPTLAGVHSVRSGRLVDRLRRLLSEMPRTPRWRTALLACLAVSSLAFSATRLKATGGPDLTQNRERRHPVPALDRHMPAGALLEIGNTNLQTRDFIVDIAFSPDGQLIAAAPANGESPRVWLFSTVTGREALRIKPAQEIKGQVTCVAFSPDQSRLAWGESGGFVAVWELARDRLLFRGKLHQQRVNDIDYSPDGKLLASIGDDAVIQLRDALDPTIALHRIAGARGKATGEGDATTVISSSGGKSLAFTPDSTRLVIGEVNGDVSVVNTLDARLMKRISVARDSHQEGRNPALNAVAVTPDGRRIMTAGQHTLPREQTTIPHGPKLVTIPDVCLWEIETGERVGSPGGEDGYGFGHAGLSPDGRRIAIADFGLLRIVETDSGRNVRSIPIPGSWGSSVHFSPDGTLVALPIVGRVALFEVETGHRLLHDEQGDFGNVVSAGWSPAGDQLVTGHEDGRVRVWDANTGELRWQQLLAPVVSRSGWNARPWFVGFSADGRRVVAAGRRDDPVEYHEGIVAIYEARRGLEIRRRILDADVRHAALAPDRKTVVVGTSNGAADDTQLIAIDMETGETVFTNPPLGQRGGFWKLNAFQFTPDSSGLHAATGDGSVVVLDGKTGASRSWFVAEFRAPTEIPEGRLTFPQMWHGAFSADCGLLVSNAAGMLYVWDVPTGKMVCKFQHPHANGCHVALSPDGKVIATSDLQYPGDYGEDTIRLFETATGKLLKEFEPDDSRAAVLAFSPDGKRLFTGYHRGMATVWDVTP